MFLSSAFAIRVSSSAPFHATKEYRESDCLSSCASEGDRMPLFPLVWLPG